MTEEVKLPAKKKTFVVQRGGTPWKRLTKVVPEGTPVEKTEVKSEKPKRHFKRKPAFKKHEPVATDVKTNETSVIVDRNDNGVVTKNTIVTTSKIKGSLKVEAKTSYVVTFTEEGKESVSFEHLYLAKEAIGREKK